MLLAATMALLFATAGIRSAFAAALPPEPFGFSWALTGQTARDKFAEILIGSDCLSGGERQTYRTAPSPLRIPGTYILTFNSVGLLRSVEFLAHSHPNRDLDRDAGQLRRLIEAEYDSPNFGSGWNLDDGIISLVYKPADAWGYLSLRFINRAAIKADDDAILYACSKKRPKDADSARQAGSKTDGANKKAIFGK